MLTELLEQSTSGARASDAEGERPHNARLLTSWRAVISNSPRGIPCLHDAGLIRHAIRRLQCQSRSRFSRRRTAARR
jgi:hypothetical protein